MKLIRRGHRPTHRGVIGVESAIVLIAFVIVAAALAFVVLNMGFATTQKAKTSILDTLTGAGSSLQVSGKVIGFGEPANNRLNATIIPLKISSTGDTIDLNDERIAVKYVSNQVEYSDILDETVGCTDGTTEYESAELAFAAAPAGCLGGANPLAGGSPTATRAFIYWAVNENNNEILDPGEHAVLAISFDDDTPDGDEQPGALDTIRAEIVLASGATLTVERDIPQISTDIVDLG